MKNLGFGDGGSGEVGCPMAFLNVAIPKKWVLSVLLIKIYTFPHLSSAHVIFMPNYSLIF